MSMLPSGLSLVPFARAPIDVRICQAETVGPAFVVKINRLSIEKFRALAAKMSLPSGIRVGSKAAREHQRQWEDLYCRTVIIGWSGLIVQNVESLLAGDETIGGEDIASWKAKQREIPFDLDLAVYLYRNTWADRFGDLIFAALREGAEQEAEEEDEKNVP